ncbi:MAG: cell division protein SepF [Staphylococcus epidermidis]|uniref:Cell division protein SepF n=4 Tax=Bacilli TaxID=91061 RepID=SEPF_STAEQ|nr:MULTISPECIES: cell division protein SepF [Staphylococcus]Q5HQ03.1 RecName: Full=Cell division protein SepF [Staphylococcus epidermidis RP62A]EHM71961.1 PF04472 family protein [Staphylococcus epidermidis 14.1.R1.SE]MBX5335171.1 cell division protein SepF [Rhodococcus fascians]SLD26767.1 cell division protein SepF [Mycobacteroides abscessus subsp. massiliense]AAW54142.1 ylmF protein [Staphylococcus epidermidis RP62A]APT16633.1 cell division protein SepF [Staphylococcus epidermidis]
MALKDLFNNFFVVEEEEEVEGPEERESSRSRERVQEREDYNRNENQATPQTFNNKQQAIKSVPQKNTLRSNTTSEERNYRMNNNSKNNSRNVVTMNQASQSYTAQESSKMCLFEPRVFSDTQDIADELKNRRATLVNLQRIDQVSAKRIIDFLSGTVYAIGGDIQRVGTDIFLCTPDNVEVAGSITDHIENMEQHYE